MGMIRLNENDIKQMVYEVVLSVHEELNESFSTQLYHFTTIDKLVTISKTGKLFTSIGNSIDSKINPKYQYSISFTRERTSKIGFAAYMNGDFDYELNKKRSKKVTPINAYWVRLEIDGNKLNNHYKGKAVNYHNFFNKLNPISKLGDAEKIKYRQSEDRLFTNKNAIELFKKDENGNLIDLNVIKRIDIYFPLKSRTLKNNVFKSIKWLMENPQSLFKDKINLYSDKTSFDNMALKDKIDNSNLDSIDEKNVESKHINEYDAYRLVPLIYILKLGKQLIEQHKVELKDIVKDILSYYERSVSKEEYLRAIKIILTVCKSVKGVDIAICIKDFNKSFLKNTFTNELFPIYQRSIILYNDILKKLHCDSLKELRARLFLL